MKGGLYLGLLSYLKRLFSKDDNIEIKEKPPLNNATIADSVPPKKEDENPRKKEIRITQISEIVPDVNSFDDIYYRESESSFRPGETTIIPNLHKLTPVGQVDLNESEQAKEASSPNEDEPSLDAEQQSVFQMLDQTSDNYFVTGKAGTGKSFLLKYFAKHTEKVFAIVAPTGIAALYIHGQTIHSFFKINYHKMDTGKTGDIAEGMSSELVQLLTALETLIIDEISMVRVDLMDMIDRRMRVARKVDAPFGGCQIICFGDPYQLPPVVPNDGSLRTFLEEKYDTFFFFGAPGYNEGNFKRIELQNIHRQTDPDFIDILNRIRTGTSTIKDLSMLNQSVSPIRTQDAVTICLTNKAAAIVNSECLEELDGDEYCFDAIIEGKMSENDYPTDAHLRLKIGSQVIILKNDHDQHVVNGDVGNVIAISNNKISVKTKRGVDCSFQTYKWENMEYVYDSKTKTIEQTRVGSFTQYPLRLAYAITVHKSQGQTYDSVYIDYGNRSAFAAGQTYVALSRCRSLQGLKVGRPLTEKDILVNKEIVDFMSN